MNGEASLRRHLRKERRAEFSIPYSAFCSRPGRDGGLAGGLGGFEDARGGAAALVRQPALTVRVDAGVRALFDRRAFGFLEALDASTHEKFWRGGNLAHPPEAGNVKVEGVVSDLLAAPSPSRLDTAPAPGLIFHSS